MCVCVCVYIHIYSWGLRLQVSFFTFFFSFLRQSLARCACQDQFESPSVVHPRLQKSNKSILNDAYPLKPSWSNARGQPSDFLTSFFTSLPSDSCCEDQRAISSLSVLREAWLYARNVACIDFATHNSCFATRKNRTPFFVFFSSPSPAQSWNIDSKNRLVWRDMRCQTQLTTENGVKQHKTAFRKKNIKSTKTTKNVQKPMTSTEPWLFSPLPLLSPHFFHPCLLRLTELFQPRQPGWKRQHVGWDGIFFGQTYCNSDLLKISRPQDCP